MEGRPAELGHVRAIDGLRGVAVVLVLAFHGGVPGFTGGYLGVSLFFTLSGYLITQLLLLEHRAHGRISLRSFWGRRLRRLAPAALVALLAVAAATTLTGLFPGPDVPGDVVASTLDVANWRFATASTSYDELFAAGPSPVLHFWSLAIEEQFYLLFPLLVACVLRGLGRRRLPHVLVALTVVGTVASVLAPTDLAYYGTHTRAPELLVGALLALALPIGRDLGARHRRAVAASGVVAGALLAGLVITTEVSTGWLYQGGLPAVSILSAALVASATVAGPVRASLGWSPAVAIGALSYGIYVYHWPLFLVLTEERTGVGGPLLFALRASVTVLVALASAALLENPVRRRAALARASSGRVALGASLAAVLTVAAVAAPPAPRELAPDPDAGVVALSAPVEDPVDVLVVGSKEEVADWVVEARPDDVELRVRTALRPDCALLLPDRDAGGCPSLAHVMTPPAPAAPPDLVVVGMGPADRQEIFDEMVRMRPDSPEVMDATIDALAVGEQLVLTLLGSLPPGPVLVVDRGPNDPLARQLDAVDLRLGQVRVSRASDVASFQRDLRAAVTTVDRDPRPRVVVIGDSTSYDLATALDAAGADRFEVVWAGRQNCPLVPTVRVRWYKGTEFDSAPCPSVERGWPDSVAGLDPDIVLATASLPELAEQRYADSDEWSVPGDPLYLLAHGAAMADLQGLLADGGTLTLLATTPPLVRGRAFDGPIGDPARLTAWLDQLAGWDAQWASVGTVDWGGIVVRAEREAGHDLRVDAVHLEPEPLVEVLAPALVDEVVAQVRALRTEAVAAGCLAGTRGERHLEIARCRR